MGYFQISDKLRGKGTSDSLRVCVLVYMIFTKRRVDKGTPIILDYNWIDGEREREVMSFATFWPRVIYKINHSYQCANIYELPTAVVTVY